MNTPDQDKIVELELQVTALIAARNTVNGMMMSNLSETTMLIQLVAGILKLPIGIAVRELPGHATMIMAELQRRRDEAP